MKKNLNKKAKVRFIQNLKDILKTKSNLSKVRKLINYNPKVSLTVGIKKFTDWYIEYVQKNSCNLIAEIGWNHMGNISLAKK